MTLAEKSRGRSVKCMKNYYQAKPIVKGPKI